MSRRLLRSSVRTRLGGRDLPFRLSSSLRLLLVAGSALLSLRCGGESITVPDDPFIGLSETIKSFSGTQGAAGPDPQTVAITNVGGGALSGLATAVSYGSGQAEGWLTAELSATSAPSTLTLTATTGSLAPGSYTALVEVSAAGANNSPQPVGVNFTVLPAAAGATIVLSSTSQNFSALQGGPNPDAQTVEVSNGGGGTLSGLTADVSYTAGQPTGWLNVVLSAATAPSVATLTATTGSLTAGTYTASIAIGSPVADNSPQTVNVMFILVPPTAGPIISLSTTTRNFTASQGGANPPARNVEISNGGGGTLSGLGASIAYTAGQPTGWLGATLNETTAPSTLRLTATTGSLAAGTYTAGVDVTSAVASNSPQSVSVTFVVQPAVASATIVLSSTSENFSVTPGAGNPAPQTVQVTNGGGGTLSGLAANVTYTAGEPSGWLGSSLSGTTAPSTLTLTVTTGPLTAGTYTANVAVSSAVASNSPQAISVTLTVDPAPAIALSSTSLTFTYQVGGPHPDEQMVDITNAGGGELGQLSTMNSYTPGQPTGWLDVALNSTTAPTQFTVLVSTEGLGAGTYTGSVSVSSPLASNSPQAVGVTLTVTEAGIIILSTTSITFRATDGGANPVQQTVEISNGNAVILSGLGADVTYVAGTGGWLTPSLSGLTGPAQLTLSAESSSLPFGVYDAEVAVVAAATNSPQTVSVRLVVVGPSAALLGYEFNDNLANTGGILIGYEGSGESNITYTAGKFGQGIKLNGMPGAVVTFPGTRNIFGGGTRWTISLWFKEDIALRLKGLWEFRSRPPEGTGGWETYHGGNTAELITTCSPAGCFSFPTPAAGVWHNLVYRYDGDPVTGVAPVQMYLNGDFLGQIDNTGVRLVHAEVADISIGKRAPAGTSEFYVDEFLVHDHVFTQAEMCERFTKGVWNPVAFDCELP